MVGCLLHDYSLRFVSSGLSDCLSLLTFRPIVCSRAGRETRSAPLLRPEVNAALGCGKHQNSLTRDRHKDAAGLAVYRHIAPIDWNGAKDLVRIGIDHAHAPSRCAIINAVF